MKLLKVRLQGFGQFNEGLDVSLSPDGLTVVLGRNEAGKSTLLNAVVGVLFGFRDYNMVRKYEPWDTHDAYGGEVEVEADDGRRLKISRDFKTHHATILELKDGDELPLFSGCADPRGSSEEDHSYFKILGGLLGFQDETVFRNTVFFGQQNLQTSVSDQIRRLLSGSCVVDYKGALHELHSRYAELTTQNPWKTKEKYRKRLIEETQSDLSRAREDWTQGRETLIRSLELETEVEEIQAGITDLESELAEVQVHLDSHERLHDLLGRRDSSRKRYEEALARRDNFKRYMDRTQEIDVRVNSNYSHYKTAPLDLPDQVRSFASETVEIEKEDGQLAEERQRLQELRPKPNTSLAWFSFMLLLGVGLALGAITEFGVPAGAIFGAVTGLVGFSIGRNLGTGFAQAKATVEGRISALETSISKRRKRADELRAGTGSLLVGRECHEVLDEYSRYRELIEEKKRLGAAIKALGDNDDVTRTFEDAAREKGAVESGLQQLFEEHPDLEGRSDRAALGGAVKELTARANALRENVQKGRTKLEEYRVELAGLSARMDFDLAYLEDDIREKEQRLERYDLERDSLKLAIDTLDTCVKDFQEGDIFRLGEEISGIFSRITDEKYSHVHLGSSMEPVISRGDNVPIAPTDLSQGARDQLYFAMRIAMARHLSRNINLPLFLDDPFVNFDEERLGVTREVISHLDDHQVVLVTCDRSYSDWGGTTIDLDEMKA